ncbi:MAG: ribosome small subunit-dependent GTPase A [Gammaproteobacteria bacterium]
MQPGLVIVNYGKNMLVEDAAGKLHRCVARRGLEQIVCGDRVDWQTTTTGAGVVEAIAERHSVLLRADGHRASRPLAANIDQIVIVIAPEPAPDEFLIDKYTVTAELAHTELLIAVNKSDLLNSATQYTIESCIADYRNIGYPVLMTSALLQTGMEALTASLTGKTSILMGQSGVGKSSLINRLLPDLEVAVGKLSKASGMGKHTTTTTTLYHLPHGGALIDSPGVRDFHLEQIPAGKLADGFREFRARLGECRFNNCQHMSEPGCAVAAAAENGTISRRRLQNYRQLHVTHTRNHQHDQ